MTCNPIGRPCGPVKTGTEIAGVCRSVHICWNAFTGPRLPLGPMALNPAGASPVEDANGSVEYKRQLVRVLVERAMREALARAA